MYNANIDKIQKIGAYTFLHNKEANTILTLNSNGVCLFVNKVSPNMSDEYFERFCEGAAGYLKKQKGVV